MSARVLFAWGPATHAYFAKELSQGRLDSQEIYGATAPDIFNLMFSPPYYAYLADQTHHRFIKVKRKAWKLKLSSFAFGFVSHNENWGSDYTAHLNGRTTQKGYVTTKSYLLAPKLRPQLQSILENDEVPFASLLAAQLAPKLAHGFIEIGIDLLVKRNEDSAIGLELSHSAQNRSNSIPYLLVVAYGKGLALHGDLSFDEASEIIRRNEEEFQQMMASYGEILDQEESEAMQELAVRGVVMVNTFLKSATGKDVNMPSEILVEFLNLAIQEVEENYAQEVAATLSYLKNIRKLSSYLNRILKRN